MEEWTYVANRVAEIARTVPEARWHHLPGRDNPADCALWGLGPSELLKHPLWWQGPGWLLGDPTEWPENPSRVATTEETRELRTVHATVTEPRPEADTLLRFSSLAR